MSAAAAALLEPLAVEQLAAELAALLAEPVPPLFAEPPARPVAEPAAPPVAGRVAPAIAEPVTPPPAEPVEAPIAAPAARRFTRPVAPPAPRPVAGPVALAVAPAVALPAAPPLAPARAGARPVRLPLAARLLATFCVWLALGAAIGLGGAMVGGGIAGYKALTVISGSMEPTLGVGSVVIDEQIAPLEARPGDVVTFHDPSRGGRLVTHRLVTARAEGNTAFMVTKGDANTGVERWSVKADGRIGRVVTHIPKAGYVRDFFSTRYARLTLLALMLAFGCWVMVDIWRRP
jgi:signal peptidase